jgi:hypothetical protein
LPRHQVADGYRDCRVARCWLAWRGASQKQSAGRNTHEKCEFRAVVPKTTREGNQRRQLSMAL